MFRVDCRKCGLTEKEKEKCLNGRMKARCPKRYRKPRGEDEVLVWGTSHKFVCKLMTVHEWKRIQEEEGYTNVET